ncbi:MAG: ankyrin repeat domain-containing protein [Luteolibacter sp.]|uniref:ankyrin repeat domain-containing protein n=1 Tax=Luteolibacter sp. TaxID=1962973 RepID=UPI003266F646
MQTNPFSRTLRWILPAAILCSQVHAEEPPLKELLRDGLYAEEVTRDPEEAAKHYEQVLARYAEQRDFAASALFRLAEVRRKQDRKDDAIKLYQRLLAEFPGAATETKLARENLAALGGEPLTHENPDQPVDEESLELLRLQKLARTSPDLLRKPEVLRQAVEKGWERPVAFLLDLGIPDMGAMYDAARTGHLSIVKMLIARGGKPEGGFGAGVLEGAIVSNNLEIVKTLLAAGAPPNGVISVSPYVSTPLLKAVYSKNPDAARLLVENGADVNLMPKEMRISLPSDSQYPFAGAPLHAAIVTKQPEMIDLLLDHKADVNLAEPRGGITPLWLAAGFSGNALGLVKRLLDLGANPDVESVDALDSEDQGWRGYPGKVTPLELAVTNGSVETVKLLLEAKKARKSSLSSTILHRARGNFEMTQLLLDYGAEPNPPKIENQSILEFWALTGSNRRRVSPSENRRDPEKVWQGMELLIERGSKVDAEWDKAGFSDADPLIRERLTRRYSYPRWAAEKSIRIVDFDRDVRFERIAKSSPDEVAPPMLEEWLLDEEMRSLNALIKDFSEFALIRKTEAGMKEIAILRLDAATAFPKLEWGDILEKRGVKRMANNITQNWSREVKDALQKRVKAPEVPAVPAEQLQVPRPRVRPPQPQPGPVPAQ